MRSLEAMPWVVGDESTYRTVETEAELALSDLWSDQPCLYFGYLLDGFGPDLQRRRVEPRRMPLAFRSGWSALAVTARVQDKTLAGRFTPYLAPTTPRPYASAPLGFALFHRERVAPRVNAARRLGSLEWAVCLQATISTTDPVFCDPILEMNLSHHREDEREACRYSPPSYWSRVASALQALGGAR